MQSLNQITFLSKACESTQVYEDDQERKGLRKTKKVSASTARTQWSDVGRCKTLSHGIRIILNAGT